MCFLLFYLRVVEAVCKNVTPFPWVSFGFVYTLLKINLGKMGINDSLQFFFNMEIYVLWFKLETEYINKGYHNLYLSNNGF